MLKRFYLLCAIIATILLWVLFGNFFLTHGVNLPSLVSILSANGAVGGLGADIFISIIVFWVWSYTDAKKNNIKHWWLVIVATFLVGLSLALPLYLYLREDSRDN